MPSADRTGKSFVQPHRWLITLIGVIVPRRLRADWKQEWEAELRYREELLARWDKLDWRSKLDLLRRSLGAFWRCGCNQEDWRMRCYRIYDTVRGCCSRVKPLRRWPCFRSPSGSAPTPRSSA